MILVSRTAALISRRAVSGPGKHLEIGIVGTIERACLHLYERDYKDAGTCFLLMPIHLLNKRLDLAPILSFVPFIDTTNTLFFFLPTMKISNLIMAASAAGLVHARDVIKKRASGFTCKHPSPLKIQEPKS